MSNTVVMLKCLFQHVGTNKTYSEINPLHERLTPVMLLTTVDNAGNTPLHHASAFGHGSAVFLLIEAGADANRPNRSMWTPLDYSYTVKAEGSLKRLVREQEAKIKERRTGMVRLVEPEDDHVDHET